MRKMTMLLSAALLLMQSGNVHAQYRVGPIYPEQARLNQTSMSSYNPFQLNWATGRFDYAPLGYADSGGPNYDPYLYNSYSGRWDYVPLSRQMSLGDPRAMVGGNFNQITPVMTQPYGQIDTELLPPRIAPTTNDNLVPRIDNYFLRQVPSTAPTTAPSMATSPGPSTRPSMADRR